MLRKTLMLTLTLALGCATTAADARGKGGQIYGFATSRCKSDMCFGKHPSGTWLHPLTSRIK